MGEALAEPIWREHATINQLLGRSQSDNLFISPRISWTTPLSINCVTRIVLVPDHESFPLPVSVSNVAELCLSMERSILWRRAGLENVDDFTLSQLYNSIQTTNPELQLYDGFDFTLSQACQVYEVDSTVLQEATFDLDFNLDFEQETVTKAEIKHETKEAVSSNRFPDLLITTAPIEDVWW